MGIKPSTAMSLGSYYKCTEGTTLSSLVGITTRWIGFDCRYGKYGFFLFQNVQSSSGAHAISYSVGTGFCLPPGIKWIVCNVNQSPPSGAEFKNEWSYTYSPPIWLHGLDRENLTLFTFTFPVFFNGDFNRSRRQFP